MEQFTIEKVGLAFAIAVQHNSTDNRFKDIAQFIKKEVSS